ncbi:MAG: hypothetical protein HYX39_08270 [Bacteroidetes bacterium]|nr:hypothetical protein [Bacteroidota bacterium]
MKKAGWIFLIFLVVLSCKKKQDTPEPTPVTPAPENGTLNIHVKSYDSLGFLEPATYSTTVFLSGTSFSSAANTNGDVSFNVPPGNYLPSVIRSKYEGFPFSSNVTSNITTSVDTSIYQNSTYSLQITGGSATTSSMVNISFNVSKSIPSGKSVRVAVLFNKSSPPSVNSYSTAEVFNVSTQSTSNLNIYSGALQTAIGQLPVNSTFYLLAIPCSYGSYFSPLLNKSILVGDYLPPVGAPTATIFLTKTW